MKQKQNPSRMGSRGKRDRQCREGHFETHPLAQTTSIWFRVCNPTTAAQRGIVSDFSSRSDSGFRFPEILVFSAFLFIYFMLFVSQLARCFSFFLPTNWK